MEDINNLKLYELYYMLNVYSIYEDDMIPYDIDVIWRIVNKEYSKELGIKLDITKESNRNILFYWLRDKTRYKLLDELMLYVYNRLINKEEETNIDNTDLFFINNIKDISKIIDNYKNKIKDFTCTNSKDISSVSKNETINMVKEILVKIDPNMEWLSIYEEAINNNKIIYLNELTEEEKDNLKTKLGISSIKDITNSCLFLSDQDYIFLTYTNTLYDIPATVHEIVHYIVKKNNSANELPILREFPSIFFEQYAINYLSNLGYKKQEIDALNQIRIVDTFSGINDIEDLLHYLIMLIDNGHISEKLDKRMYNKELKALKRNLSKKEIDSIILENPTFFDVDTNCNKRCDKVTYDLILNPYILSSYYPYIIGSYLADIGIERIKEDVITLPMLKYITEKISKIDAYDIFYILKCNIPNLVPTNYTEKISKKKRKIRDK